MTSGSGASRSGIGCAYVYSHEQSQHRLSATHPMRPIRLAHMHELIAASGLLDAPGVVQLPPEEATTAQLLTAHDADYVDVVKAIDRGGIVPEMWRYGFGPGDNPPREGVYRHAALAVGGAMVACQAVLEGDCSVAFAPAGGMHHHAMHDRAAGFGIFNDAVVAIKWLIERGLRVLYVDIDVHHGDGVQAGLYDTERALTLSIHESGQWLFPGTGNPDEIGTGDGIGYSVNVPLAPGTADDAWHEAFDAVFRPVADAYRPDFLFTQLGIDTHRDDPLAHLELTTQGHNRAVRKFADYAREHSLPWVAVGGGGYNFSAVARGWTMDLATMAGAELPEAVPAGYGAIEGLGAYADADTRAGGAEVEDAAVRAWNAGSVEEVRGAVFGGLGV